VRDEVAGRYKTKALLTVAGIGEDGYREILGLKLAESEGEDLRIFTTTNRFLKSIGIGSFLNERSLIKLAVAILIDINEEWLTGSRHLDMEENSL